MTGKEHIFWLLLVVLVTLFMFSKVGVHVKRASVPEQFVTFWRSIGLQVEGGLPIGYIRVMNIFAAGNILTV